MHRIRQPVDAAGAGLTHAGTLGVLAMGMIGALYQMTPVVAGSTSAIHTGRPYRSRFIAYRSGRFCLASCWVGRFSR